VVEHKLRELERALNGFLEQLYPRKVFHFAPKVSEKVRTNGQKREPQRPVAVQDEEGGQVEPYRLRQPAYVSVPRAC